MTTTQNEYPSETSGLVSSTGASVDAAAPTEESRRSKWFKRLPLIVAVFVVLLMGANLVYNDFFIESPEQKEEKLVQQYTVIANQSMGLLNANTNTSAIAHHCESTVIIIRHCEDLGGHVRYADGSSHCSYLGFQRSLYFASLFGSCSNGTINSDSNVCPSSRSSSSGCACRWPTPAKLYGMFNAAGNNKRQYEMLRPLSDKIGVPIQMFTFETAAEDVRKDLFQLMSTGQFCNKVAVVTFKHKFIRGLAATLGCDQEKGCPGGNVYAWDDYDFDTVWELQFVYRPPALRAYPLEESIKNHRKSLVDGWKVYGSTTQEYFDALEFSDNWVH